MQFGTLLQAVIPIFAVIAIGFIATAHRGFGEPLAKAVNDFVYYVALPALLFQSVVKADLSAGVPANFLSVNTISVLAVYSVMLVAGITLFRRNLGSANGFGLVNAWGNVAYLGIPLLAAIKGPGSAFPAAIASLLHNLLCIAAFLIFATVARQREYGESGLKQVLPAIVRRVLINPVFLPVAVGVAVSLVHLPIPQPVDKTVSLLAPVAAPGGLFALGVMLRSAFRGLREGKIPVSEISVAVVAKLALMPALAYLLTEFVFPMPPMWAAVTVTMCALPNAATVFVLTQQYKAYEAESTAIVVATTVLSLGTLPLALALLPF
jgi:malonate transporter